jgi:para-nitrobenzyl esterase
MKNFPTVETTNGTLRGVQGDDVCIFKGVRYAASTGGANRFRPPQPVEKWAGVQDALAFAGSAPQFAVPENTDPFYAWYAALQPISEDCLFLNVFTPKLSGGRLPVLFWIHGGGWREFSGTAPGFNGTNLARAQDVVVVTINHRLNGFGFLDLSGSDERFDDAGNAGLLDVVAALSWVRDNIAAFGGDPANVTIFGESGGASKIAAILSMPAAKGLFHKAILQSSAGGMRLTEPDEAGQIAAKLARVLGLDRLDGDALQKIPMQTLIAAMKTAGGPYRGIIDGRNFHDHPFGEAAPAIAADVAVMAGCTNTETTYHLRFGENNFALDDAAIRRRLTRFFGHDSAATDEIIARYRDAYPGLNASNILIMITSDFVFKRNTYRMAELQAAASGLPVFAYLFERETPVDGGVMRAAHTNEVPFIFGTTQEARFNVGAGPDIAPMTATMQATWAAFARSGDPNNPMVPEWKPYSGADRQMMVLNVESRLALDPGGVARAALDGLPYFGYGYALDAFCRD